MFFQVKCILFHDNNLKKVSLKSTNEKYLNKISYSYEYFTQKVTQISEKYLILINISPIIIEIK